MMVSSKRTTLAMFRGFQRRIRSSDLLKTSEKRDEMHTITGATSKNGNPMPLYSIRVTGCCANLYEMWHKTGVNSKKPLTGVDLDVVYVDTMPSAPSNVPVIVGLHGAAATHLSFGPLLSHFQRSSTLVRVILPNFPGWGFTESDTNKIFGHSEDERAAFIQDFLNVMNIKKVMKVRVRVLIAHSTSFYAALGLYEQSESIAFVNPVGLKPLRMAKPVQLKRLIAKWFPFVQSLLRYDVKLSAEQVKLMSKYILYVDYEKMKLRLLELVLRRYPLFVAVSNEDSVLESDANRELIEMLNLNEDSMFNYDKRGERTVTQQREITKDRYSKGLIFDNGDHELMKTYPEILAKEILRLSDYVGRKPFSLRSRNDAIYLGN